MIGSFLAQRPRKNPNRHKTMAMASQRIVKITIIARVLVVAGASRLKAIHLL